MPERKNEIKQVGTKAVSTDISKKRRKPKFRLGLAVIISLAVMAIVFCAYMVDTSLEDVLIKERGEGVIITHTESES